MDSKFPEVKTERLILREASLSDAQKYHELLSIEELSKYSNIPQCPTIKRSERFIDWMSKLYTRKKGCAWIITHQNSEEVIGAIRINAMHKKASYGEIGYELHPDYWNRGLMTEAVSCITHYGHTMFHLNRMEAWVIPGNVGSEAVLMKAGYTYEGTLRQRLNMRGQLCDTKIYSHLISDEN